jgi:hypothetical protein
MHGGHPPFTQGGGRLSCRSHAQQWEQWEQALQPIQFHQQIHGQGETEELQQRQRQLENDRKRADQTERQEKLREIEDEQQWMHKPDMQQEPAQLKPQQTAEDTTATLMMAVLMLARSGCDDFLDLPLADFRAVLATLPELSPVAIDQLHLARKRKRNRQYAQRSRMRRQSSAGFPSTGGMYARKINALKTVNSALRSCLVTTQRPINSSVKRIGY